MKFRYAMEKGLVSVAIATFNQSKYIAACVESALSQSYKALEVVVVDDGSTDETSMLLDSFTDKILVLKQENKGQAAARNIAMEHCRGEYIAFMDSDDLWDEDKILTQVQLLESHPGVAAVYCDHRNIDENDRVRGESGAAGYPRYSGRIVRELLIGNCIRSPSLVLARRSACQETNGFDVTMRNSDDWNYWLQLALRGAVLYQPVTLASYRENPQGISKRTSVELARAKSRLKTLSDYRSPILEILGRRDSFIYEAAYARALTTAAWQSRTLGKPREALHYYWQLLLRDPLSWRAWPGFLVSIILCLHRTR